AVPKAFPRQYQVDDENHLQSRDTERNVVATPYEILPNTRFTSRDPTAIPDFRRVTGLVTVKWYQQLKLEASGSYQFQPEWYRVSDVLQKQRKLHSVQDFCAF